MAGAIAGTAILNIDRLQTKLHTVTVTVNNSCNLACPHCYLQYRGPSHLLQDETIRLLVESEFEHLAIVGKEPLANGASVECSLRLLELAKESGKLTSIITNGTRLKVLEPDNLRHIDYVDVSFDGGVKTYGRYRGGDIFQIIEGIQELLRHGYGDFNALHTIGSWNLGSIDDMMGLCRFVPFNRVLFSPYLETQNHGLNRVSRVSLRCLLQALSQSDSFREETAALLLIDSLHIDQDEMDLDDIRQEIVRCDLESKVRVIPEDPLFYGILRVTYDALVMPPLDSLHTSRYSGTGRTLSSVCQRGGGLSDMYQDYVRTSGVNQWSVGRRETEFLLRQ